MNVEIIVTGGILLIVQCNKDVDLKTKQSFIKDNLRIEWAVPYSIL